MAAITRAVHDPLGFPTPAFAAVRLAVFMVLLPVLLLGLPLLAGFAIFLVAA